MFAFDFAFAFALAIVGACGCAAMPPTEGFVVCNFFLGPLSFAEKYSRLEAVRWIFAPIDFFDFNRTQMIAVGIAP